MDDADRPKCDREFWFLKERRYLLHDRDTKFTESFRQTLTAVGVEPLKLPIRSKYSRRPIDHRWVRFVVPVSAFVIAPVLDVMV